MFTFFIFVECDMNSDLFTANNTLTYVIKKFFDESDTNDKTSAVAANTTQYTQTQRTRRLICYFIGLQVSFILWGYLQEKIMTQVSFMDFIRTWLELCYVLLYHIISEWVNVRKYSKKRSTVSLVDMTVGSWWNIITRFCNFLHIRFIN